MKKKIILMLILSLMIFLVACGDKSSTISSNNNETTIPQQESTSTSDQTNEQETEEQPVEMVSESEPESSEFTNEEAAIETSDSSIPVSDVDEKTADELLDLFINGTINAVDSADLTSTFYVTDLDMDSEEWDSYSIGERVDLDNDGENELIICGPYGGMYLDARDGKVFEFAAGGGTALTLSYVVYNGSIWIMYSNNMNEGYKSYHMEKFEGADNLVAEMDFSEELIDENNAASGMKYTLNGNEISYDEYAELGSKIFATEVYTN